MINNWKRRRLNKNKVFIIKYKLYIILLQQMHYTCTCQYINALGASVLYIVVNEEI